MWSMESTPRLLLQLLLLLLAVLGLCMTLTAAQSDEDQINCEDNKNNSSCICRSGYEPCPDDKMCCDINECKRNNSCGNQTKCKNTFGGYNCTCIQGFQFKNGSQHDCEDINECKNNVCNNSAKCINVPGSYKCEEPVTKCQEFTSSVPSSDDCSDRQTLYCNFTTQLRSLCTFSMSVQNREGAEKQLTTWLNLLDYLMGLIGQENEKHGHHMATVLMEVVESWLREHALTKLPKESIRAKSSEGTELAMEFRTAGSQSSASLVQNETRMDLDWQAAGKEGKAFSLINLLTYQGLEKVLTEAPVEWEKWKEIGKGPEWPYQAGKPTYRVLSKVSAAFVDHSNTVNLNVPVSLGFSYKEPDEKPDQQFFCAFWKPNNGSGGSWSAEGCSIKERNSTHAHCQCNHLTSFAILMAFYEPKDWILDVISRLGLVVSLVCLFLAILTFLFCRTIRGIRTTIHLNLCLALFAAYVIFLMGVDNPGNKLACAVVAGLLHYFFLSVFCWMLLEGVELYLMVVQVFKTHSLNHWHIYLVGYGLPAIVVAISAAVNREGYGTKSYCWLSMHNGFLWSFLAPVCLIIMFNAVVFVVTVWRLTEKFADINPDISKLKKQRVLTITAIAQLCILGLTWTCGLFQFSYKTIAMSYIFTILNTLQGLFIFLLHCLLKKQVRDDYYHMFCRHRRRKGQSSDKYSEFSSTSASNTLRAHKSTQESGI